LALPIGPGIVVSGQPPLNAAAREHAALPWHLLDVALGVPPLERRGGQAGDLDQVGVAVRPQVVVGHLSVAGGWIRIRRTADTSTGRSPVDSGASRTNAWSPRSISRSPAVPA
jgi:hypothetical protein